jgi:hypothetical protein
VTASGYELLVGVVDPDEELVDVVHGCEQVLGHVELTGPEAVEEVTAQLGGRLGQTAEPGGETDGEAVVVGQIDAVDEGGGEHRLDVLLLGVVEEAGVGEGRERRQCGLALPQRRLAVGEECCVPFGVAAVHGPDGATGGPDGPSTGGQTDLACLIDGTELGPHSVEGRRQLRPTELRPTEFRPTVFRPSVRTGHVRDSRRRSVAVRAQKPPAVRRRLASA